MPTETSLALIPYVPQFFFDDALIAYEQKLTRNWLTPKTMPTPALVPDRPWEKRDVLLYGSVLPHEADGWRMYYSTFSPPKWDSVVMMATSRDGFMWEKPELGAVEWEGSRKNNIVLRPPVHSDSPSVVHDPADSAMPFKLLMFHLDDVRNAWSDKWGLYAYQSPDGINWSDVPGVRLRAGDRTTVMSDKIDGRFVCYTRHPQMGQQTGGRAVYLSTSADFNQWTDPELVLRPDLSDPFDTEFYGMAVFRRNGWFFGLVEYWRADLDVIEIHLVISRDGRAWRRTGAAPFIAAAYDWNRTWNTCASNGPIYVNEQMVFYFGGRWTSHHWDSAQHAGAIGFASMPLDRFCAIEGGPGGHLITHPIAWPGGELVVNADTRQSFTSHPGHCNGELTVEVLDANSQPLPDYSGAINRATFRGNTHCRGGIHDGTIKWPNDRKLDALRGQPIRLKLTLAHTRLFTIEARRMTT